ncbi:MAG: biosynthetic-type acetolactate synthase large subunit [Acidobacteria bacterium]|nr:biosynthetic-type acetolactate synthase large subunit [Candidatus Sulfomarinibacter kjeldsenii]MBD3855916.1 biosynthetic-type acetolactate synthase large subunit [Candidatus Sulfomarinibacter kjeldsenii]
MELTGAEIVWECLIQEGVDLVFGYPGGAILPTYDALSKYPQIHHVLPRHEQGASHMADGYARATGKVGVAMATSGPGATNLVTGLATAMLDSSPIVCLTGQVPTPAIGYNAFQEADITGITLPITKHNYLVTSVEELAFSIREAFHIARSGRPGPVLIDLPKDVQTARTEFVYPTDVIRLPGYQPVPTAPLSQIEEAQKLIRSAERPVILAGRGVLLSGACAEVVEFAEHIQTPVSLTLLGKGCFPENHPLCLGMMGMHGAGHANHAVQEADLLLAFGMRFDDRVTGNIANYAPKARKVHIDIDPSEINKNVEVDVGIAGDLKETLDILLDGLEPLEHGPWIERISRWRDESTHRELLNQVLESPELKAAEVVHDLWTLTGGEAITVTDVGQHQMWVAQYYKHSQRHALITSGGMGTMGFGLPAGIGAAMGRPDDEVWVVVGDGGFQMTMAELATAMQEQVNVKIALINNGYLGMVRQWQELFYEKRYNATPMLSPDFCALAAAYGVPAVRVEHRDQIEPAVNQARSNDTGPFLIEFVVEQHDVVFPMVPAGADLHDMIRRPITEHSHQKES